MTHRQMAASPKRGALMIALLALLLAGCPMAPTFTAGYTPERAGARPAPLDGALAVRRFEDRRPPRVYSSQGRVFMTYIPIIPYVTLPFERMDENARELSDQVRNEGQQSVLGTPQPVAPEFEQYAYPSSFARAVAADLAAQQLFREVRYTGSDPVSGYRYVLSGVVRETPLEQSVTSYCLGAPGVLLWVLPLPMAKTTGAVTVDLTLNDTATSEVVWQHTLQSEVSRLVTLYNSEGILYGGSAFSYQMVLPPADAGVDRQSLFAWHFAALRQAMNEAKPSLAAALAGR